MEEKKKASEVINNLYEKRRELVAERMKAVDEVVKLYFDLNNQDNAPLVTLSDFDESRTTSATLLSNFDDEPELVTIKSIVLDRMRKTIDKIEVVGDFDVTYHITFEELSNDDTETILELILDKM